MKRLMLIAALVAVALATAGVGESASKQNGLCVGGPHCLTSIQAALNAAQDGDTIRIGPGSFTGGVTITKSVDLVGVAAAASMIVGGGPVVTIGSRTSTPTVTLENLTVTGGLTTTNPQAPNCGPDVPRCGPGYADATSLGGGVETFTGSTVTIVRSVITGNRSTPALSTPSVKAVCPNGPCPAQFGDAAGIDNWGTMTLIDTTVSDNHASSGAQSNGGGIVDEANSSLTIQRSRVTGNSASAVGPFGRFVSGGGILVAGGGTLTVEDSAIDGNRSELSSSIPHPFPFQDGGNDQANSVGGGIYVSDGATATIRNSSLDRNAVTVDNPLGEPFGADAALCACGGVALTLENSTVNGNTLSVNVLSSADTGPSGPGALEGDGQTTITNSRISGNSTVIDATNGDAATLGTIAFFLDGTSTAITNSTISDNTTTANAPNGTATLQGAGIANNGPLALTNDTITRNRGAANGQTGSAQGGGIWNGQLFGGPESPLTLVNTSVARNALSGSAGVTLQGGGIFTPGFPTTLTNSSVAHNTPDQCFGC